MNNQIIIFYLENLKQIILRINKKTDKVCKTILNFNRFEDKNACLGLLLRFGFSKKYEKYFKPFIVELIKESYNEFVNVLSTHNIPLSYFWDCVFKRQQYQFYDWKYSTFRNENFLTNYDSQINYLYEIWNISRSKNFINNLLLYTVWTGDFDRGVLNKKSITTIVNNDHKKIMDKKLKILYS